MQFRIEILKFRFFQDFRNSKKNVGTTSKMRSGSVNRWFDHFETEFQMQPLRFDLVIAQKA